MANDTIRHGRRGGAPALMGERAREQPLRKPWKAPVGPPPTLGQELKHGDKWMWFWCPACQHHGPLALAPLAIRFGMSVATIDAAQHVVCSVCGHRGATLQRPHIGGVAGNLESESFPAELATAARDRWIAA